MASTQNIVIAATRKAVLISLDRGASWKPAELPAEVSLIANVAVAPGNRLFVAAREGAYRSEDAGLSWQRLTRLPVNQLASIYFDEDGQRLLTTSETSTLMYQSPDFGKTWKRVAETGWIVRKIRTARGRMLATTIFDGIVAPPEAVVSQPAAVGGSSSTGGLNDE